MFEGCCTEIKLIIINIKSKMTLQTVSIGQTWTKIYDDKSELSKHRAKREPFENNKKK